MRFQPDVVLLDVLMPGQSGVKALPEVLAAAAGTKVLVLSILDDDAYVRESVRDGRGRVPSQGSGRPRARAGDPRRGARTPPPAPPAACALTAAGRQRQCRRGCVRLCGQDALERVTQFAKPTRQIVPSRKVEPPEHATLLRPGFAADPERAALVRARFAAAELLLDLAPLARSQS